MKQYVLLKKKKLACMAVTCWERIGDNVGKASKDEIMPRNCVCLSVYMCVHADMHVRLPLKCELD